MKYSPWMCVKISRQVSEAMQFKSGVGKQLPVFVLAVRAQLTDLVCGEDLNPKLHSQLNPVSCEPHRHCLGKIKPLIGLILECIL